MSSSLSELGKRKNTINDYDNIILSPLKKYKISPSFSRNYSFSSLICVDFIKFSAYKNCTSLCINNHKNIFSVGQGYNGSHGHEYNYIFPIKQINNLGNIRMISCKATHTTCLSYDGDVYSFGNNKFGQLGIGKTIEELEFTYIPQKINISSCKQVSCGSNYTICLTEDNTLYSFGDNNYGQLGLGNNKQYNSPQLIPDLINVELIVCELYHCLCKTYNNDFYSWGYNEYGQLGQGNNKNCNKPIQCLNWPDNIISIKCGDNHTLLLTSEGQIYSFGLNIYGQLGINDKNIRELNKPTVIKDIPEIQRIACGKDHSMCIDINNNIWLFGDNYYGQLGLGDQEHRYKPILLPTLSNIIDISSGGDHTFVKTIDNKIYAFGYNKYSQLGIKTSEENQLTPIQVFQDNEDIWCSTIGKSKQKSARK